MRRRNVVNSQDRFDYIDIRGERQSELVEKLRKQEAELDYQEKELQRKKREIIEKREKIESQFKPQVQGFWYPKPQKKMKLELNNFDEFYRFILSINPYEFLRLSRISIETRFSRVTEYIEQFTPNFFNEVRGYIENSITKQNLSRCIPVEVLVEDKEGFIILKILGENNTLANELVSDTLLLVVSARSFKLPESFKIWRKIGIHVDIAIFNGYVNVDKSTMKMNNDFCKGLKRRRKYLFVPLDSLTTLKREYAMIKRVESLALKNDIFSGVPPRMMTNLLDLSFLRYRFNPSQLKAIQISGSLSSGILLLQGPPGTGKTETILGILSVVLFKRAKILVCAPSNIAIDGIASRVLEKGLFDMNKATRKDIHMLRIGSLSNDQPSFMKKHSSLNKPPEIVKRYIWGLWLTKCLRKKDFFGKEI